MNILEQTQYEIRRYVEEYYPPQASKALVMFSNEYNDEGYDVAVQLVLVYDKDDNELVPPKGRSIEARQNLPECWEYIRDFNDRYYEDRTGELNYCKDLVVEL